MKELLFSELKLPPRDNTQEDTLVALLGNHTEAGTKESEILSLILELRQLRTNYGYLEAGVDPDGRIRTTYRITGTETGRTSTGVLGPPIRPWHSGMAFQTIPKHGPFSKYIRSIFIPPPGYVFLEVDLSQAEARIVALLADDEYTLKLFNSSDIHSTTASWIFNVPPEQITKDQRFIGKMVRHAGNYGMGKKRLMLNVNADAKKFGIPVQLSEARAKEIIDIFHLRTPKIRHIFHTQVREQVHKDRTLFNPFGRMRQFFGYLKDEELFAQIPQSTVSDHLRTAGLRIKDRDPGIRICAEIHDAFLLKVKEEEIEKTSKLLKEELEQEIDFSKCSLPRGKLKIPVEIQVGTRLSELKKL
jgi:DNA polymerase-1